MASALKARLAALEAIRRAAEPAAPVLVLLASQDREAAIARFIAAHGHAPAETITIGRKSARVGASAEPEGGGHG